MGVIFGKLLKQARIASRWVTSEEFSTKAGVNVTTLDGWEMRGVLPSRARIDRIRGFLNYETGEQLYAAWAADRVAYLGIELEVARPRISVEDLAKKLQNEAVYVLKQAQIKVPDRTAAVMERRFLMLLRDALGE